MPGRSWHMEQGDEIPLLYHGIVLHMHTSNGLNRTTTLLSITHALWQCLAAAAHSGPKPHASNIAGRQPSARTGHNVLLMHPPGPGRQSTKAFQPLCW